MTAINFTYDDDRLFIASDSLVSNGSPDPSGHGTKVIAIPHLRMVMASMGSKFVADAWLLACLRCYELKDMEDLDAVAPDHLARVWREYGLNHSTTIFHFGIERSTGEIAARQYSSAHGFAAQRYPRSGTYNFPRIEKPPRPAAAIEPSELELPAPPPVDVEEGPPPIRIAPDLRAWPYRVQSCIDALTEQRQQHPEIIGGAAYCTLLQVAEGSIKQWCKGAIK